MYYIREGEVKFKIYNEEFTAKSECIVRIPSFAHYTAEALVDSDVYDVGGLPRWYAYLQDRESIMTLDPDRWAKPETKAELKKKFNVEIKSIT